MKHLFTVLILVFVAGISGNSVAQEVKINHNGTDGLAIETDGTIRADGDAACWRDELQELIGKKIFDPKKQVAYDLDNATITFNTSCDLEDYVIMNVQLNHDWDEVTPLKPHLHWEQVQNATPNWLLAYRWQVNGQAKNETWIELAHGDNAFTYTSGTMIQITEFADIDIPSGGVGTSSIIQLKLMRDTKLESSVYTEDDPYTVTASGLSLDIHIRIDTFGSRTEYTK